MVVELRILPVAWETEPMVDRAEEQDLSSRDKALIQAAREIAEKQTDDVVHTMGAAVSDTAGTIYVGVNLYHFTGGPCAELVALGAARAAGAQELVAIVAVGNNGRGVRAPCGRDRQILADYYPDIRVIVPTDIGLRNVSVAELLPYGFDWNAESQR